MDEEYKLKQTKAELHDVKAQIAAREKELRQQGMSHTLIGLADIWILIFEFENFKLDFEF